jgi:hypothetical protein
VLVTDGVFSADQDGTAVFYPTCDLDSEDFLAVQTKLRKPTLDGRTELVLTPLELLDRLAHLVTPPRIHKHRYCGVLAPNAKLRRAVTESAGPAGATLQLLQEARDKMGLPDAEMPSAAVGSAADDGPKSVLRRAAAHCWALLLVRIYECLPLRCSKCGEPMRIIAFVLHPPVIVRMELLRNPAFGDGSGTSAKLPKRHQCPRPGDRLRPSSTSTRTASRTAGRKRIRQPPRKTIPGSDPHEQDKPKIRRGEGQEMSSGGPGMPGSSWKSGILADGTEGCGCLWSVKICTGRRGGIRGWGAWGNGRLK